MTKHCQFDELVVDSIPRTHTVVLLPSFSLSIAIARRWCLAPSVTSGAA